jgi:menaquinone-dependent protoporphyrinogen oxidase
MPNTSRPAEQKKTVAVLYGSSASQTRAISERIAGNLRASGLPADSVNLQGLAEFDLSRCVAVVLLAPVRQGKHEQAVVDFVKTHRAELDRLPVAFISATIEAEAAPPEDSGGKLAQFDGDVQMTPNPFFAETGWRPTRVKSFGGAISFTRYNLFVRIALKLLAPKGAAGAGSGGVRREAGWDALDLFVSEFVREIRAARPAFDGPSLRPSETEPAT